MKMHRTQIYLDDETRRLALWQAKLLGTSLSGVLRQSVKKTVQATPKSKPKDFTVWLEEFHQKYPTPPGTPTDLAIEHDHYLYGTPKKYAKKK